MRAIVSAICPESRKVAFAVRDVRTSGFSPSGARIVNVVFSTSPDRKILNDLRNSASNGSS